MADTNAPIIPELTLALLSAMNDGKDPRQLEQIVMPNKAVVRVSDEITGKCKLLKKIDLSKNLLSDATPIFQSYLPNLTWVSIANNQIGKITFPEEDEDRQPNKWHIKVFNASGNQLTSISFLARLGEDVKAVILSNNEIRDMSGLSESSRAFRAGLDTLVLSHNKIERVSESLATLECLSKLNLGNNLLREVPSEVFRMTRLRELRLNGNKIMKIPPREMWQCLQHLSILDLGNNQVFNVQDVTNLSPLSKSLVQVNFLGNPIAPMSAADGKKGDNAADNEKYAKYKALIMSILPNLTNLDNTSLTGGSRKKGMSKRTESSPSSAQNTSDASEPKKEFPKEKKEFSKEKKEFERRGDRKEFVKRGDKKEFEKRGERKTFDRRRNGGDGNDGPEEVRTKYNRDDKFKRKGEYQKKDGSKYGNNRDRKSFRDDNNNNNNRKKSQRKVFGSDEPDDVEMGGAEYEDMPEEVHSGFGRDEKAKGRNVPSKVVVKKREEMSKEDMKKKAKRMVFDDDGEDAKEVTPAAAPKTFEQPPPQKKAKPAPSAKDFDNNVKPKQGKKEFPKKEKKDVKEVKEVPKKKEKKEVPKKEEAVTSAKTQAVQQKQKPQKQTPPPPPPEKEEAKKEKKEKKKEEKEDDEDSGLVDVKKSKAAKGKTVKSAKAVMKALLANPDEEVGSW